MHHPGKIAIIVSLLVCGVFVARGTVLARADSSEPEQVVSKALDAQKKLDWKSYAKLVHPDTFAAMQAKARKCTQKLAPASGSNTPPESLVIHNEQDCEEWAKVVAENPEGTFIKFLEFRDETFGQSTREYADIAKAEQTRFLGTAYEKPDFAHVIVERKMGGKDVDMNVFRLEVISLKRSNGKWMIATDKLLRIWQSAVNSFDSSDKPIEVWE